MKRTLAAAILSLSIPAFAQTTTTVSSQPPPPPPTTTVTTQSAPPPPPPSTTVTTQTNPPPPPSSSTQVVVNPNDTSAPPPRTRVRVSDDAVGVSTVPNGRSSVAIVATDALYGGIAGALIGGGVTLIDQGNHWERDLMVGAGVGVLVGAAYGVYEAAMQPSTVMRAAADRDAAASDHGTQLALLGGRF